MRPEGTKTGRKVSWPVLAALFLIPLLVAAPLLGLVGNKGQENVTAAIVNLDDGTEIDGQFVPMGRQLTAEIMGHKGAKIDWVLADEPSADEGLLEGTYSAAITIPDEFSEKVMSFAENDAATAERAKIEVDISKNAPAADAQLAQQIARIATESLNNMLTSQYLDGIYVGFNEVGGQFGKIVDGASQLHDGSSQLADGVDQAADGGTQLADGMDQLSDGSGPLRDGGEQLVDGTTELESGAGQLADGMGQLSDGSGPLRSGGNQLADGTDELASGAEQLADGASQLNAGVQEMAGQMPALTSGVQQLVGGANQLLPGVRAYTDGTAQVIGGVGQLEDGLDQIVTGMDSAEMDFSDLQKLADGSQQVADGVDQLYTTVEPLDGLITDEMIEQTEALAGQAGQLGELVGTIDDQLQGYADGTTPIPAEVTAMADQLKSQFQCPIDDPDACAQMQAAYEQGIDQALGTGFQQGAGAAIEFLDTTDPQTGKTYKELAEEAGTQIAGNAGPIADSMRQLQTAVPNLELLRDGAQQVADGNQQLATELPAELTGQMSTLRNGIAQVRDGAGTLVHQSQPLIDNGTLLADGSDQLLDGINQLGSQLGALPEGVEQLAAGTAGLSDGAGQLSDGVGQYAGGVQQYVDGVRQYTEGADAAAAGAGELADGVGQYAGGIVQYVDGVWQYSNGVDAAAVGTGELVDGLGQLGAGAGELSDGLGTFAGELEKGKDQIPNYSESDRETLGAVVSSPVDAGDTLALKEATPVTALVLVGALWLASLAAFTVVKASPSNAVASGAPSALLWAKTVGVPTGIVMALGAVLGLIGGGVLQLPVGKTAGFMILLTLLGFVFSLTQHALAGWLGHIGRGIALVLLAVTVALGLSSAVPGWLSGIASLSPVHSGLLLVRSWLAGAPIVTSVGVAIFVALLMGALSFGVIASRRQLSPKQFKVGLAS